MRCAALVQLGVQLRQLERSFAEMILQLAGLRGCLGDLREQALPFRQCGFLRGACLRQQLLPNCPIRFGLSCAQSLTVSSLGKGMLFYSQRVQPAGKLPGRGLDAEFDF